MLNLEKFDNEKRCAGIPVLGARLLVAANLLRKNCVLADIGCDHGKLSVYAAMQGISKKVIAVDLRPLPLARAAALSQKCGVDSIVDCRLGSGLRPLKPKEATDIVIAGVSGETAIEVIKEAKWTKSTGINLVLIPPTHADRLRKWLYENGFEISEEIPVQENARFYSVILAFYTGKVKKNLPEIEYALGKIKNIKTPETKLYINRYLAHLKRTLRPELEEKNKAELETLIKDVEKCLN